MNIADLNPTERAFWMGLIAELDAEPLVPVPCIAPQSQFDPSEEPDIDMLLALMAAQAAPAQA